MRSHPHPKRHVYELKILVMWSHYVMVCRVRVLKNFNRCRIIYVDTISSIVNDLRQTGETVSNEEHISWLMNGVAGNPKFIAAEASIDVALHLRGVDVSTVHNILLRQKSQSFEKPKYSKAPSATPLEEIILR